MKYSLSFLNRTILLKFHNNEQLVKEIIVLYKILNAIYYQLTLRQRWHFKVTWDMFTFCNFCSISRTLKMSENLILLFKVVYLFVDNVCFAVSHAINIQTQLQKCIVAGSAVRKDACIFHLQSLCSPTFSMAKTSSTFLIVHAIIADHWAHVN